ncbi:MAG: helix-turn-helix domain-containing protein [Bacteroidetes bacterium]|nr:helix-turn-helix domain-containing protein [Bacteroidota bacterium]
MMIFKVRLIFLATCVFLVLGGTDIVKGSNNEPDSSSIEWQLFKNQSSSTNPPLIATGWHILQKKRVSEGINPKPIWLRLEFTNPKKDSATFYWVIPNSFIDTIDIWKDEIRLSHTGLSVPFNQRPFKTECFVIPVKVSPAEKVTIYTRLAIRSGSLNSTFLLLNKNELNEWIASLDRFNFIYFGLILNIFLIAVVVSLISGRSVMVYYAIYMAAFILFQLQTSGYAYHYFWPGSPYMAFFGKGVLQLLACFFFWLFCAQITQFSKLPFLISQRFKKTLLLFLPLVVITGILLNANNNDQPTGYLIFIFSFIYLFSGFIDLCICIRHRFKPAYGVFIALCFPITASIIVILRIINILPSWGFIDYIYPLSFTAEVVLILIFTIHFIRKQNRFLILQQLRFQYHQNYIKRILLGIRQPLSPAEVQQVLTDEISKPNFPPELLEKDFALLSALMTEQKLYTDPEMSLQSLAKKADVPFSRASRSINLFANKNFSKWLNELRIEEAKRLLYSEETEKYTLEAIATMAGFASRSNFNTIFKQLTNYSPSEYKKMKQANQKSSLL